MIFWRMESSQESVTQYMYFSKLIIIMSAPASPTECRPGHKNDVKYFVGSEYMIILLRMQSSQENVT